MELALGTVQFGLRYGVAGRASAVPKNEVRVILAGAHAMGIRVLDTAAAYGDIETHLASLANGLEFRIVSKLPPCPSDADAISVWAAAALRRARERLGSGLSAMLFHRAEDLLEQHGAALWAACGRFAESHGLQLGVSCYDAATLERVRARFPITIAQIPGNALDQRLRVAPLADGSMPPELHLRSAFLQGLLLMPEARAATCVPAAAGALARWHAWCRAHGYEPLTAALGVVKGLPGVTHCVVGVDNLAQLEQIVHAWNNVPALHAVDLHADDQAIVDPRRWPDRP